MAQEEEFDFWDKELSLTGHFAEFTKKRIDPKVWKEEFPSNYFELLIPMLDKEFPGESPFKVVELGSGPVSNLAYGVEQGMIDVKAVDILADRYRALYQKHDLLDFPVKPIQGCGEDLATLFKRESFHCAFAQNALDHTHDIVLSFNNLVSLVKKGGFIILQHAVREGSFQNWSPSHRWDLELSGDGFVAYDSEGKEFQLQRQADLEFVLVYYSSFELGRMLNVVFRRRGDCPARSKSGKVRKFFSSR
jgi:SAM-dependent methyltransferase